MYSCVCKYERDLKKLPKLLTQCCNRKIVCISFQFRAQLGAPDGQDSGNGARETALKQRTGVNKHDVKEGSHL